MSKLHTVKPNASEVATVGTEPMWTEAIPDARRKAELQRGLNWHNEIADKDDFPKYIEEWLEHHGERVRVAGWRKVSEKNCNKTLAALARMGLQGFPLNQKEKDSINGFIIAAIVDAQNIKEDATPRLSVQDHMRAQVSPFLSTLDHLQDMLFDKNKIVLEVELPAEMKPQQFAIVKKYIVPKLAEWTEAVDALDKKYKDDTSIQLAEAYTYAGKKTLKLVIKTFEDLLVELEKKANTQKVQQIRKKKPADKAKLVKKLKYLSKDETLGLESIASFDVIGATSVWVYDTTKRKLGHYVGESSGSLYVKGTTLLGFDEKKSVQKTLRKPEEQLKEFMKLRKVTTQREWFDGIKSVGAKLNGRTNDNLLILRAE